MVNHGAIFTTMLSSASPRESKIRGPFLPGGFGLCARSPAGSYSSTSYNKGGAPPPRAYFLQLVYYTSLPTPLLWRAESYT